MYESGPAGLPQRTEILPLAGYVILLYKITGKRSWLFCCSDLLPAAIE